MLKPFGETLVFEPDYAEEQVVVDDTIDVLDEAINSLDDRPETQNKDNNEELHDMLGNFKFC
jgi:hypothetical protein